MYKIIIGVDVSKDVLDIAYFYENGTKYLMQVPNTYDGILTFLKTIKKLTSLKTYKAWLVCFENTGIYSDLLLSTLIALGIACVEEHAMKIKAFSTLQRGKRDDWDAVRICEYAVTYQSKLTLSRKPDETIAKLKHLFNYRSTLVNKKVDLSNCIDEKAEVIKGIIIDHLKDINDNIIATISSKIKEIEKLMLDIVKSVVVLRTNYNLVTSVIGIGPIIGLAVLIKTENFEKFKDSKKFASQIGIAPFPHQSGKSYRNPRISKRGDMEIKALITNGVQAAKIHDPQITNYYVRLSAENKKPYVINNNIKNKLIHRIFAVVRRGTPYVKLVA